MNYEEQINELILPLPINDAEKLLLSMKIGQLIIEQTMKQQTRDAYNNLDGGAL